jgi:hypothetical protein
VERSARELDGAGKKASARAQENRGEERDELQRGVAGEGRHGCWRWSCRGSTPWMPASLLPWRRRGAGRLGSSCSLLQPLARRSREGAADLCWSWSKEQGAGGHHGWDVEQRTRALGRKTGSAGVEGAQRPWEAAGDLGDPALAAVVVGEEIRLLQREGEGGREWRLGNFEGWECKTAKGKERAAIYRETLGLGFQMGQMGWTGFGPKH